MISIVLIESGGQEKELIRTWIKSNENLVILASGTDYFDALALTQKYRPNILLLDAALGFKGGEAIMPGLKWNAPETKIALFGSGVTDFPINEMVTGTFQSCLINDSDSGQLEMILGGICRGKPYVNFAVYKKACQCLAAYTQNEKKAADDEKQPAAWQFTELSKTEIATLRLFAGGRSNREIAAALNVTEGTVRNYFSSIMKKAKIKGRHRIILYAQQCGIAVDAALLPPATSPRIGPPVEPRD